MYTMEHYSTVQKNEIMNLPGNWMKQEKVILNKVTQTYKDKRHAFSVIWGF